MKLIKIDSNGLEKYSIIYRKREVIIEIYQFISLLGKKEIGFNIYKKKESNMIYRYILRMKDDKFIYHRLGGGEKIMVNILNLIPQDRIRKKYIKINGI